MIIALSDTHLGSPVANERGFRHFINEFLRPNQSDIEYLFLLGDILDLWRRPNPDVLADCRDVLRELSLLEMEKVYLVGNHDYEVLSLGSMGSLDHPAMNVMNSVGLSRDLEYDGIALRLCHGYQMEYWPSLPFYESFCKAMCYYDSASQELSDLWGLVERFAEREAPAILDSIRGLEDHIRKEMEATFAAPLNAHTEDYGSTLLKEWNLLSEVSSIDELEESSKPELQGYLESRVTNLRDDLKLDDLTRDDRLGGLAQIWEELARIVSRYSTPEEIQPTVQGAMHQCKRLAGSLTIGLEDDEFLVRGHGHQPYVSEEYMIADAGCWLGDRGSYLEICNGKVTSKLWTHQAT